MKTTTILMAMPMIAGQAVVAAGYPEARKENSPKDGWNWKFREFVIGGWWGPAFTDAELKLYKECGFNLVMWGRRAKLESDGDKVKVPREFDLAQKYGLNIMFDTYAWDHEPWGGKPSARPNKPKQHSATLAELKWLYENLGSHPALVGFLLDDDNRGMNPRLVACTDYLRNEAPHLMPWICQDLRGNPQSLAAHGNPIYNLQIYPTGSSWGMTADRHVLSYATSHATQRNVSRRLDLLFWPMFNSAGPGFKGHCPSDSLVRFPAYAALAYGAQGIWYFTYNNGALSKMGPHETEEAARKALTPLYDVAKKQNLRIAAWGPRLLGTDSTMLFSSYMTSEQGAVPPAGGMLVEKLDDKLLVGILTKDGKPPLAMVVDCRATKNFGDLKPREVTVTFSDAVKSIRVLETAETGVEFKASSVSVTLDAGEGQLLELQGGAELDRLASGRDAAHVEEAKK